MVDRFEDEVKRTDYGAPRKGTIKKNLKKLNEDPSNNKEIKKEEKEYLSKAFDSDVIFDGGREKIIKLVLQGSKKKSECENLLFIQVDTNCLDEGGFSQVFSGKIIKESNIPQIKDKFNGIKTVGSIDNLYVKRVAIKTIPHSKDYKIKGSEIEEIEKEIKFLEMLENFDACVYFLGYAHSKIGNVYHLIFEYFDTDLQKHLRDSFYENRIIEIEDKIKIISQIIAICSFLQKNGILHRDLKPKNFLLNIDRCHNHEIKELRICDFGVALLSKEMSVETFTLAGTKHFLAPEYRALIKKNNEKEDVKEKDVKQRNVSEEKTITISDLFDVKCSSSFKSDVFSLGLNILYILGFDIIRCNTEEEYLQRVIYTIEKEKIATPALVSIIRKCLEWDKEKRPDFIYLDDYFIYVLHCPFSSIFSFDWTKAKEIYVSKENFEEIQDITDKDKIFKYFVSNGWKSSRISSKFFEILYLSSLNKQIFPSEILSTIENSLNCYSDYEEILRMGKFLDEDPFVSLCKCYTVENGSESIYKILNKNIGFDKIEGEISRVFLMNFLKYMPKTLNYVPEENVLYRGIPTSNHNHKHAFKLRSEYLPGICFYWTAFVSATKLEEVATGFLLKEISDEGILFVIRLNNKNRMYDIQRFSEFQSEAEVLLAPYFYFKVVANEAIMRNGKNICRITIEEKQDKSLQFIVLRIDAEINNPDNYFLSQSIRKLNIEVFEFSKEMEALEFIETAKEVNIFVVCSGSLGKTVLPQLKDYDNVVGFGVYCWDVSYHKAWANKENLPKLVFLSSSSDDIIKFFSKYRQYFY